MTGLRRSSLWLLLLLISLLVHFFLSWQAGRGLDLPGSSDAQEVVELELVVPREAPEPPEPLLFEDPPELDPPAVLVAAARGRMHLRRRNFVPTMRPRRSNSLCREAAAGAPMQTPQALPRSSHKRGSSWSMLHIHRHRSTLRCIAPAHRAGCHHCSQYPPHANHCAPPDGAHPLRPTTCQRGYWSDTAPIAELVVA